MLQMRTQYIVFIYHYFEHNPYEKSYRKSSSNQWLLDFAIYSTTDL